MMFKTVEKQIDLVNQYNFPATFLFQYDALINPGYQKLMKTKAILHVNLVHGGKLPSLMWKLPD